MEKSNKKTELGRKGEGLAAEFLSEQGFWIRQRNWRYKHKEIDIIAENDRFLVITEVKTRAGHYKVRPGELVNRQKQKFLIEAAEAYINLYSIFKPCRFDVIMIALSGNTHSVEHIPDAFVPGES